MGEAKRRKQLDPNYGKPKDGSITVRVLDSGKGRIPFLGLTILNSRFMVNAASVFPSGSEHARAVLQAITEAGFTANNFQVTQEEFDNFNVMPYFVSDESTRVKKNCLGYLFVGRKSAKTFVYKGKSKMTSYPEVLKWSTSSDSIHLLVELFIAVYELAQKHA